MKVHLWLNDYLLHFLLLRVWSCCCESCTEVWSKPSKQGLALSKLLIIISAFGGNNFFFSSKGHKNKWFVTTVINGIISRSNTLLILLCRHIWVGTKNVIVCLANSYLVKSLNLSVGVILFGQDRYYKMRVWLFNKNSFLFLEVKFVEAHVVNMVVSCGQCKSKLNWVFIPLVHSLKIEVGLLQVLRIQAYPKVLNYRITEDKLCTWKHIKLVLQILPFLFLISL